MKIAINGYEANVVNRVGSGVFAYHVLVELEQLTTAADEVTVFLPTRPLATMPKERSGWRYRVVGPSKLWSMIGLPMALWNDKLHGKRYDVVYSLGHYAPQWCPAPSVVSIMDLAYLKFPELFRRRDVIKLTMWTASSVQAAKHVITISEATKRDIATSYKKKDAEITVAYPGFQLPSSGLSLRTALTKLHVKQPYIAYIGTIQPRKNLVRLVKAFELIARQPEYKDLQLVIGGKVGWLADEFVSAVQHSPMKKRIQLLGFVSDEEKLALYAKAEAVTLVGLYEGFGIPPLEAMAQGALVVVSNTASLPEVVGPAGFLVDPYSIEDIARGLREALECKGKVRELRSQIGRVYSRKFSWRHTAQRILDVLHTVGRKKA